MLYENYVKIHTDKKSLQERIELAKLEVKTQTKYKKDPKMKFDFRYWPMMATKHAMINIGGKLCKAQQARLIPIVGMN